MQKINELLEIIENFPNSLSDIIGKQGLFLRKENQHWIGEVKAQNQCQNLWYTTKAESLEELLDQIFKKIEKDTMENFYGF
jgi:hypothetical protein